MRRNLIPRPSLIPGRLHLETLVCSVEGHYAPAADVRELREEDGDLGIALRSGKRMVRCLRCDMWMPSDAPGGDMPEHLPALSELEVPRRGKLLREAVMLRLIACERLLHVLIYGLAAIALFIVSVKLPVLQHGAAHIITDERNNGQLGGTLLDWLRKLDHVNGATVQLLAVFAGAMALLEGVEAFGLWRERRWAEYLTAVANTIWIPYEVHEMLHKVSWLSAGSFVLNLAVVLWLVYRKRLFGLRGGMKAEAARQKAMKTQELSALVEKPALG